MTRGKVRDTLLLAVSRGGSTSASELGRRISSTRVQGRRADDTAYETLSDAVHLGPGGAERDSTAQKGQVTLRWGCVANGMGYLAHPCLWFTAKHVLLSTRNGAP